MPDTQIALRDIGVVDAEAEIEFDAITEFVAALAKAPIALVTIVEPEKDRQFFKSARGLPEPWASLRETPLSHSFCKHVRESGEPLIVNDARTHQLVMNNGAIKDLGVIAYLGVPILGVDREPIGALCAIDNAPRAWSAAQIERLEKMAIFVNDQIRLRAALKISERRLDALTVEIEARIAAEAELSRLASADPLTGLLNRRSYEERAKREIARLQESGFDAALFLIDLDHFKAVNDTHGHGAGDLVLIETGRRVAAATRGETDILARFGGEEFVLVLPEVVATTARDAAERCRLAIKDSPFLLEGGVEISVTASIGVALLAQGAYRLEDALKRADAALYAAKQAGRDRVVIDVAAEDRAAG